jgi:hypothetical protein
MGTKHRPNAHEFDSDPYDEYDDYEDYHDDFDDRSDDMRKLSKDFYSTDWEDPSGPESRFSTRRKIERRNDLKRLYSQIDDLDELDFGNDW